MPRKLIPEVQKLVSEGKLSQLDAEWIVNLSPEGQLPAAEKCIKGDLEKTNGDNWRKFQVGAGKGNFRNQDKDKRS